jgi:hypothetical protein
MGYFAVCHDTENNSFGIWESTELVFFLRALSKLEYNLRSDIVIKIAS